MPETKLRAPEKFRQVKLVGRKIRQLRKSRHLTQTELSGLIGVQQSDLSRMEKGEYKVSLDTLFKILSVFEMNIGAFFEELVTDSLAPNDVGVLKSYKKLSRRSQQDVRDFIDFKRMQDDADDSDADDSDAEEPAAALPLAGLAAAAEITDADSGGDAPEDAEDHEDDGDGVAGDATPDHGSDGETK